MSDVPYLDPGDSPFTAGSRLAYPVFSDTGFTYAGGTHHPRGACGFRRGARVRLRARRSTRGESPDARDHLRDTDDGMGNRRRHRNEHPTTPSAPTDAGRQADPSSCNPIRSSRGPQCAQPAALRPLPFEARAAGSRLGVPEVRCRSRAAPHAIGFARGTTRGRLTSRKGPDRVDPGPLSILPVVRSRQVVRGRRSRSVVR